MTPSTTLPVAALDPDTLDQQADQTIRGLLRAGTSPNTVASYRSAMRYWSAWFALRYRVPLALPLSVATVQQFIADHAESQAAPHGAAGLPPAWDAALVRAGVKARLGAPSLNTLMQRIAVMSKAHTLQGLANPCQQPQVRELLASLRRAYARRGHAPARKAALTREPLQAMLDTCDDSLRGLRDRALLLFAWSSGGRRRSEVVAATLENTTRTADGFLYVLRASKTNQAGTARPGDAKPIVGAAAVALQAWLAAAAIEQGPLFRRIRRGNVLGEPLAAAAVRDIVRYRGELAGLAPAYSAHSLRSGFVTEAGRRNIPLGETMALTGHTSIATVMGYFHAGALGQSRAARLLDEPAQPATGGGPEAATDP